MNKTVMLISVAIVLRIILALISFHPDLAHFIEAGKIMSSGHILDFYDLKSESQIFNYPPVIYWLNGVYSFLFTPFGQNVGWLFKLGYLPFDLILGLSLMRLFTSQREKLLALGLWLFNPVNLYATYLMGQFDVIPTSFAVLSLVLLMKGKETLGALSLGVGIAFKIFPIFLLVPYVLQIKSWSKRILISVLILAPYIIGNLIYLTSDGFRSSALVASQSLKSFYAAVPVSGGQAILLFPAVLIFLYGLFLYQRSDTKDVWRRFFITLSLFFVLTHTHPQWLIWLTPFLIIGLVESNFKYWLVVKGMLIIWFIQLFFFDPSLTVGLFSPIMPTTKESLSIWQQHGVNIDYNFARSLLHSAFSGLLTLLVVLHFRSEK